MISIAFGVSFSANLFRRLCVSASINCEENYSLTGFKEVSPWSYRMKGLIKKLLPCYNKLYFLTWKSKVAKNGQKLILSMKNGL